MKHYEVSYRVDGVKRRVCCPANSFEGVRKLILKVYPNAKIVFIEELYFDYDTGVLHTERMEF